MTNHQNLSAVSPKAPLTLTGTEEATEYLAEKLNAHMSEDFARVEVGQKLDFESTGGRVTYFVPTKLGAPMKIVLDDWRPVLTLSGQTNAVETVEQEIQRKGLTAPRITPADIEANIASEHYFTAFDAAAPLGYFPDGTHTTKGDVEVPMVVQSLKLRTFCVLVLRNGYTVYGASACASPENFNAELIRRIARENAVREIWPLMGYALREKLAAEPANLTATEVLERHAAPLGVPAGADWREPKPQDVGHTAPGATMPLASDGAEIFDKRDRDDGII